MNTMAKIQRSKITDWVLNILGIFILVVVIMLFYWSVRDYDVLTPLEGNYDLEKTEFVQGEVLNIRFRICKNISIKEEVYGKFIDGIIFTIPSTSSNFDVDCYDTYLTGVRIPKTLPEGDYIYREEVVYRVNPLREVSYKFTTPEFRVVERE